MKWFFPNKIDDTKTVPYDSFVNSKAKNKMFRHRHEEIRDLFYNFKLPEKILLAQ